MDNKQTTIKAKSFTSPSKKQNVMRMIFANGWGVSIVLFLIAGLCFVVLKHDVFGASAEQTSASEVQKKQTETTPPSPAAEAKSSMPAADQNVANPPQAVTEPKTTTASSRPPEEVTVVSTLESETAEPAEQLVSLDFKDADIKEVLSAIAKAYGLNIIAGKEIIGKVSISLTDVTLEEALDSVLGLNKYTYMKEGNIITVVATSDQLSTEIFRLEFAQASEVKDLFKNMLSEKGDLRVNERLNEIIITDTLDATSKARELLYRVDTPPPQVVIEAKLVDVDPTDLSAFGMDWDINYRNQTGKEGRTLLNNFDYNMQAPTGFADRDQFDWKFTTPFFTPENAAQIDFMIQETKANLLSAPRIAVLNNQPAKIVIGSKVGIKEQTQTASGTIESVRFVDVGITLKVTPQINEGGYVSMEVSTEVSSVSTYVNNLPVITTREASTHVRVKDRETIVIAGLLKDSYSDSSSRFPFFSKIPILGNLLGKFGSSRELKELIVFLTPNILAAADRVDPKNLKKLKRQQSELDAAKMKHEEMMSVFRKGGMKDAIALNSATYYGEDENLFERAQWFEQMAHKKFRPSKYRPTKEQYLRDAAISYRRFAEAFSSGPRAAEAFYNAAVIYDKELGDIQSAYELYRIVATDYPESYRADEAVRKVKKIGKQLEKQARDREKHKSKIVGSLKSLGIEKSAVKEEIGDIKNAKIPVSSP